MLARQPEPIARSIATRPYGVHSGCGPNAGSGDAESGFYSSLAPLLFIWAPYIWPWARTIIGEGSSVFSESSIQANLHVPFDDGCGNGATVGPQSRTARRKDSDKGCVRPTPRHTPTLPNPSVRSGGNSAITDTWVEGPGSRYLQWRRHPLGRGRPDVVLIEGRASGTQLIQEPVAEGICAVTRSRRRRRTGPLRREQRRSRSKARPAAQWRQTKGLRRLEIPDDMQKKYGFAPFGRADGPVKSAIFAGNTARLYDYEPPQHPELALPHTTISPRSRPSISRTAAAAAICATGTSATQREPPTADRWSRPPIGREVERAYKLE